MEQEKVRILIVEDEAITAMALEDTLVKDGYTVVGKTDNGSDALVLVQQESVDLVLLDIHVKGALNGIETAHKLSAIQKIPFIFLTAYSDQETLRQAKETNPSAYLIKPYQARNLLITIDLALHNFALRQNQPEVSLDMTAQKRQNSTESLGDFLLLNQSLFLKQTDRFEKIKIEEIQYFQTAGNYTDIFVFERKYTIRQSLQDTLQKLNQPYFLRLHRSYAVNLKKIVSFNTHSVFIGKKTALPIGRHYRETFLSRFK